MALLDLLVRAAAPRNMPGGTPTPGTKGYNNGKTLKGLGQMPVGNALWSAQNGAPGPVKAATIGTRYASPGQAMPYDWDATTAIDAFYFGSQWIYRCVRTIAETAAMLPIRAGADPTKPNAQNIKAPLAQLLGPPPGTPNKRTSSRSLIAWSFCQYICTGRWAWEAQLDPSQRGNDGKPAIVALWPLVAQAVMPVPTFGGTDWWASFKYQTPTGIADLSNDRVIYAWRPSQRDWRQPEACLESARHSMELLLGIESAMVNLTKNGLIGSHIVVSPPFEEEELRRAWQDQFVQEFGGYRNAAKTIFAEAELPESGARIPNVQITPISTTPLDAQLLDMWQQAKIDITVDLGVPESLVGNASQRTYANADSEYRNFWTVTMLSLLREQEDHLNTLLAPRLGNEVCWFDVSKVVALQPPALFPQLDPVALIQAGVTSPEQIAAYLNLPALTSYEESPDVSPLGEEAVNSTSMGGRSVPKVSSLAQVAEMLERRDVASSVGTKRIDEIEKWMSKNEGWLERAAAEAVRR